MNYLIHKIYKLNHVNWINLISVLLGTVMLQVILWQSSLGHLSATGFSQYLHYLTQHNTAPAVWNHTLLYLSEQSLWSVVVIWVLMLLTTAGLLFCFNPLFPFLMFLLFGAFWISHIGHKGNWLFELLFPTLFSLILGIAQWELRCTKKKKKSKLGFQLLPKFHFIPAIVFSVFIALVFCYFNYLSKNGGSNILTLSLLFGGLGAVGLFITLALDTLRTPVQTETMIKINSHYLTIMASVIGLMLVYQVNADISLHWFTLEGYKKLVDTYQATSSAPGFIKLFLGFSASIASILAPAQFIFETLAAICLFLGIFRIPMYWLTTGLLGMLMIVEFGVPATWPPTPTSPTNWLWELLLPTSVLLMCSIHASVRFLFAKSRTERWLGVRLFKGLSCSGRTLIFMILLGIFAIFLTMSLPFWEAGHTAMLVLNKSVFFVILLFIIMIIIDPLKTK